MRQQHVTHLAGTFPACSGCQREPMHIATYGRSNREANTRATLDGERHHLECNRCGRKTAMHPSVDAAIADWTSAYALPATRERTARRAAAPIAIFGERACTR